MCGNVKILDDILVEEDETIEVIATLEQNEPEISLIRNSAPTTITDNDCKNNVYGHIWMKVVSCTYKYLRILCY